MSVSHQGRLKERRPESRVIRERRQLVRTLQEGRHASLGSVYLRLTNWSIRKISGGRISFSFSQAVLLISLVPLVAGMLVGLVSPGVPGLVGALPLLVWAKGTGTAMLLAARFYGRVVLDTLISDVIPNLQSVKHIRHLDRWLVKNYSRRRQFRFSLYLALVMTTASAVYAVKLDHSEFLGLGPLLIVFVSWFEGGLGWYFTWPGIMLPSQLAKYEFVPQVDQPPGSTLVGSLEQLLRRCLVVAAILASILTGGLTLFFTAASRVDIALLILMVWVPMLSVFAFYHFSIRQLVSRLNSSLLARIQEQVRTLFDSDPELSQETISRIRELHQAATCVRVDKALATSGTLESVMGLGQSLALPVLPPLFIPLLKYLMSGG